ncbi:MAG: ThiF family adenylyltransferase [Candidatus Colwellbacteria bacterium]|nr:ThiF family adenylyltransferase [Candidatus Colwellbacteria bacterium]
MSQTKNQRYQRQKEVVNSKKWKHWRADIIGCGAVGRQVAVILATIGFPRLVLYDGQTVEEANLGAQGFAPPDLGKNKARAVADTLAPLLDEQGTQEIVVMDRHFTPQDAFQEGTPHVVFCMVDTMSGRKNIVQALDMATRPIDTQKTFYLADTRVLTHNIQLHTITSPQEQEQYLKDLPKQSEIEQGRCSNKMTFYAAQLAASLAVGRFVIWLSTGKNPHPSIHYNIDTLRTIDMAKQQLI